jgi:hypothetical protein
MSGPNHQPRRQVIASSRPWPPPQEPTPRGPRTRRNCGLGAGEVSGARRRAEVGGGERIWWRRFRRAQVGGGGWRWARGFRGGGGLQMDLNY